MFTIFEADTFIEYTQSVYVSSVTVLIFLALLITAANVKKLFKLIGDCENLTETSEWQTGLALQDRSFCVQLHRFSEFV